MTKAKKVSNKGLPVDQLETVPVGIRGSYDTWSTTTLEDGTVLRLRPVIVEVERAVGEFTDDDSPVYVIKSSLIIDTKSPPELKRSVR